MAKEFVETVKLFLQEDEVLVCIIGAIFKPFKIQRRMKQGAHSPLTSLIIVGKILNTMVKMGESTIGSKGIKHLGRVKQQTFT